MFLRNSSICLLLAIILVGWSCSSSQMITSSWINPEFKPSQSYSYLFVAALTDDRGAKQKVESALSEQLGKLGVRTLQSIEVFPPNFAGVDTLDKHSILHAVRELGCEAIFTITLIDIKEEERYHPGQPFQPGFRRYGFYNSFNRYYAFRYPMIYEPGYYTTDKTYIVESNLYDVNTGSLLWTVQSSAFNPSSFEGWFRGYSELMLSRLNEDGFLEQGPPILKDDLYDMHTAQLSLDWNGTYSGILPCASCKGIDTELTIRKDRTYELAQVYVGKSSEQLVQAGKFVWRDGNTIMLQGIDKNSAASFYKIEEQRVRQLDLKGEVITGKLADQYLLTKHGNPAVENRKWKLIELNGKVVEGHENSHYVIFNSENGMIEARAGCNNLAYPYKIKNELQFSAGQGMSTLMACQNDLDEQGLKAAIEQADNLSVTTKNLTLNKAKMAPLARFELVE